MSERVRKVNQEISRSVSETIERERLDKRSFVTVTAVEAAPDLKHAIVWCSVIGLPEKEALELLRNLRHPAQKDLNSKLAMKYIPRLDLRLAHGGEYAQHIENVMKRARGEGQI